jgi:hypothetical protein
MMNFWVPNFDDWNDEFEPEGMPWYTRYDFVEYWEYVPESEWATTEIADRNHPFKFTWRDDFDTFDESRWLASDHFTFDVNNSMFMES